MSQRVLPLFLTAAMILNMYHFTVLAEAETLEISETAEVPENGEVSEETKNPEEPELSEGSETSEEPEVPEETEAPEPPAMSENSLTVSENTLTVSENSVTDIAAIGKIDTFSNLDDSALEKHIVRGQNPEGAVVNLFDYWQDSPNPEDEEIWDWEYTNEETGEMQRGELCNLGISRGHLLRFGQTKTEEPEEKEKWNYGAWNMYSTNNPYQGIVQNTLDKGFPKLNFKDKQIGDFGNYATNYRNWLDNAHREESLAYLFSVTEKNSYKASYANVQGLFQMDQDGYYYYDSRKNFAEFDKANSRFILYDSPGVGKDGYYGQFFPFNKASEVFDTEYDITDGKNPYPLSYTGKEETDNGTGEKTDYVVRNGNASFVSCTYPALNHYIGMTLKVPFLQTVGGCLDDGSDMTFEFSGDDDVWIFIDGVLVADLGGIHDAYELSINFANGKISIPSLGEGEHTLRDSFEAAGRSVNGFSEKTFADNTKHTLQMFYLERGHMASNLSLRFNVVVVEDPRNNDPGGGDPGDDPEDPPSETEDPEEAPGTYSDTETASTAQPTGSEQGKNAVGSPQTGDDSMIGWWAALNLISLVGICATVYNLILRNSREKKRR